MPRPLSDSWQYFDLLPVDGGKNRQAKCRFCGHKQAAGITRLHQHLLLKCTKISTDVRNELKQKEEVRGRGSSHESLTEQRRTEYSSDPSPTAITSGNLPDLTAPSTNPTFLVSHTFPLQSNERSNPQQQQSIPQMPSQTTQSNDISQTILDWHLARALFSANIPFDRVENPHFIDFLKCLQPNYTVPKSSRLKQLLLKEQHWDLINWNESNLVSSEPLLQQNNPAPTSTANNTASNADVLASIHPPVELEGSL